MFCIEFVLQTEIFTIANVNLPHAVQMGSLTLKFLLKIVKMMIVARYHTTSTTCSNSCRLVPAKQQPARWPARGWHCKSRATELRHHLAVYDCESMNDGPALLSSWLKLTIKLSSTRLPECRDHARSEVWCVLVAIFWFYITAERI